MDHSSTLLIIADDWEALERYEERLALHFEVHCAPFGVTGLEMARELKPNRILIDLVFEDMNVAEALSELKNAGSLVQTVVVSDINIELSEYEKVKLLTRPFDFQELIEHLR